MLILHQKYQTYGYAFLIFVVCECTPDLCENGGTCNNDTKECTCPPGYSGTFCQKCKLLNEISYQNHNFYWIQKSICELSENFDPQLGQVWIFIQVYPQNPCMKIKMAIWNHQADYPLYLGSLCLLWWLPWSMSDIHDAECPETCVVKYHLSQHNKALISSALVRDVAGSVIWGGKCCREVNTTTFWTLAQFIYCSIVGLTMDFLIRSEWWSEDEKTAYTYETTVLTRTGKVGVVIIWIEEREGERERGDEGRRERGCMLGLGLGGWVLRDVGRQWSEVQVGV